MRYLLTVLVLFSLIFGVQNFAFAENIIPNASVVKSVPSSLDFAKTYKTTSENLLYLLLAAINEYNYSIEEIQFKTGSVLFKAYSKEFIASVSSKDGYNSFIKIIPADNIYNFSPSLLQKLHNYIELNNSTSFQKIL